MMTEELVAAGLLAEPAVQSPKIAQPSETHPSPAASESKSHEDGEVRSDDEDVGDVDTDLRDLVTVKRSKGLPAAFVFGESKVTTVLIREYEADEFFPAGSGRAPLDEEVPSPEANEVVMFRDFFHLQPKVSLRSPSASYFGQVFYENPSALPELILGSLQVPLDHEDFRVQLQR
jgi:hypothetical protein